MKKIKTKTPVCLIKCYLQASIIPRLGTVEILSAMLCYIVKIWNLLWNKGFFFQLEEQEHYIIYVIKKEHLDSFLENSLSLMDRRWQQKWKLWILLYFLIFIEACSTTLSALSKYSLIALVHVWDLLLSSVIPDTSYTLKSVCLPLFGLFN